MQNVGSIWKIEKFSETFFFSLLFQDKNESLMEKTNFSSILCMCSKQKDERKSHQAFYSLEIGNA